MAVLALLALVTLANGPAPQRPASSGPEPSGPPARVFELSGDWAFATSAGPLAAVEVLRRGPSGWQPAGTLALDGARTDRPLALAARGEWLAVGQADHPAGGAVFLFAQRDQRWVRAYRILGPPGFGARLELGAGMLAVGSSQPGLPPWRYLRRGNGWDALGGAPGAAPSVGGSVATARPAGGRSWQYVGAPAVSTQAAWSGDLHVDATTGELFESHQLSATGRVKVRKYVPGQGWAYLGTDADPLTNAATGSKLSWYNVLDSIGGVPAFVGRSYQVGGAASARIYLPQHDQWVDLGPPGGIGPGQAHYTQLVYDSQGTAVIAYQDDSTFPPDQTTVERYDATLGVWKTIGLRGINGSGAKFQSLGIDSLDRPVVAFSDTGKGGRVVVMRWEPVFGEWRFVGDPNGFSPQGSVQNVALLVSPAGDLFVAYRYLNSFIQVMKHDPASGTWSPFGQGFASAGDAPEIETETWRNWIPMAWSGDRVLIGYQLYLPGDPDDGKAVVRGSNGGSWESVGPVGFTPQGAYYMTMATGLDGTPYVAFRNEALGDAWSVMGYLPD